MHTGYKISFSSRRRLCDALIAVIFASISFCTNLFIRIKHSLALFNKLCLSGS